MSGASDAHRSPRKAGLMKVAIRYAENPDSLQVSPTVWRANGGDSSPNTAYLRYPGQMNQSGNPTSVMDPELAARIASQRSGGAPLSESMRDYFEPRFGYDFSRVRVHSGREAAHAAQELRAQAFTVGNDIVFDAGRYATDTRTGRQLLAHELTHVIQQSGADRHAAIETRFHRTPHGSFVTDTFSKAAGHTIMRACEQGRPWRDDIEGDRRFEWTQESSANARRDKLAKAHPDWELCVERFQRDKQTLWRVRIIEPRARDEGTPKDKGDDSKQERGGSTKAAPKCKNLSDAQARIVANPRKYGSEVTMFLHRIEQGQTLTVLARAHLKDNKVLGAADLATELDALNKGLNTGKIGNCAVLIRGWTSPRFATRARRANCADRIADFKKQGQPTAVYSNWETEVVQNKDTYTSVVNRVSGRRSGLYNGRAAVYSQFVEGLNSQPAYLDGTLGAGDCVALPVGWKDPKIGTLPATAPTAANLTAPNNADVLQTIAVVYGEQTDGSTDQQLYIWYSIRARIASAERGSDLRSVALSGEYHAQNGSLYNAALKDLRARGGPTDADVIAARDAVLNHWTNALPADAGRFYFHWLKDSSPERCYGASQIKDLDQRERECAWQRAKALGWVDSSTTHTWRKRIRGTGGGRIGSMYIFP
jgi:hypothetical protein